MKEKLSRTQATAKPKMALKKKPGAKAQASPAVKKKPGAKAQASAAGGAGSASAHCIILVMFDRCHVRLRVVVVLQPTSGVFSDMWHHRRETFDIDQARGELASVRLCLVLSCLAKPRHVMFALFWERNASVSAPSHLQARFWSRWSTGAAAR